MLARHFLQFALSALIMGYLTGCSGTNFAGSSGSQNTAKNSANSSGSPGGAGSVGSGTSGQTPGSLSLPGTCGAAGATQAKLITPSVQNGVAGNFLAYELFLTDCQGNRKAVSANSISFDVDAVISLVNKTDPLPYTLQANDSQLSGLMAYVPNSDLFGKQGPKFFHYASDKPFSLLTAESSVKIYIQLGGRKMEPYQSSSVSNASQLLTYLRIGEATPVSQVVQLLSPPH